MSSSGYVVTADAQVVPPDVPIVRADDLGIVRGDGVFDRMLVFNGQVDEDVLAEQLARLQRSATMIGLAVPRTEQWRRCIDVAISVWTGGVEMGVRFIVTRGPAGAGPTWYLLVDPVSDRMLAERTSGLAVRTLERGIDLTATGLPWLLHGAKTLSYAMNVAAVRWAQADGADDAIFVSGETVLESPNSAVLIARDGVLFSPPDSLGILPSLTLARLGRAASRQGWTLRREALTVDDLHGADGVWLLSAARLATRVHTLDCRPLADTGVHEKVRRLADPAAV